MYKRVLFALDLEGVNLVVGEPYEGLLHDTKEWDIARKEAVREINAAADALFSIGVERVGIWDNHGGGKNIDPASLDARVDLVSPIPKSLRMSFANGEYDCICFFGYHTMEGTLGGVLAHTMSSKSVQYYKLNGKYIGEVDMDAYIAAEMGMPSVFFCAGDLTCKQAKHSLGDVPMVITKRELSRNKADFRDSYELLADIKRTVCEAVRKNAEPRKLTFPATLEKSFKRVEDAEAYLARLRGEGIVSDYLDDEIMGKDAHTVASKVNGIDEFIKCI